MASNLEAKQEPRFIVVIGTSAGGLNALTELVSQLNPSIDAAFFIVMHLSRMGIGDFLIHRLSKYTTLPCDVAKHNTPIERGHIYIAPPNFHLVLKKGEIAIGSGPEENRWRPSIDVLFRSAAANYDGRVIGVVLTGLLDDGTMGMLAIRRSGGRLIVQDPNTAEYPDMPLSVLNNMPVDECCPLSEIGTTINKFAEVEEVPSGHIPEDIKAEAEISEKVLIGIDIVSSLGDSTVYSCPTCGGGLWKIEKNGVDHYRCHIGHSFSEKGLNMKQSESLEGTLWVAMRIMEERRKLLKDMEEDTDRRGFRRVANEHRPKRREMDTHIDRLKELLFAVQRTDVQDTAPNL